MGTDDERLQPEMTQCMQSLFVLTTLEDLMGTIRPEQYTEAGWRKVLDERAWMFFRQSMRVGESK